MAEPTETDTPFVGVKAILFDIDGTLVDSNAFHVSAWEEAFAERGLAATRQAIAGQIGKGGDLLIPALFPDVDEATAERLAERHGEIFADRYLVRVRPFAGATELLRRVHESGRKVALASSAKRPELDHYVELLDVDGIVDAAVTIDDVDTSKPAPDIFAVALQKLDLAAADVRAVGDTPYDVEAAKKCGIATLAVRSGGFADEALTRAGARALYDDVADLLGRLEPSSTGA